MSTHTCRARRQGTRLLAAKAAWGDEHDALLALSSEAGQRTAVLDVRGTHFRPADLPALEPGAATLALAAVPGGWLVQATAHVRSLQRPLPRIHRCPDDNDMCQVTDPSSQRWTRGMLLLRLQRCRSGGCHVQAAAYVQSEHHMCIQAGFAGCR